MKRAKTLVLGVMGGALVGCEPATDVEVLPLPPLEYASAEARLGLPELEGRWRFTGWEVVPGDSSALTQAFPRFGELIVETQRLDSVAGVFTLHGGVAPVVGEVRRDGWVALVTLSGSEPTAFVTARHARDTLWLEMSSIVAAEDWPRGARAVFVRGQADDPGESIAWFRGTVPGAPSASLGTDSLVATLPPASASPQPTATIPATPPATSMPPTPLGTPTRDEGRDQRDTQPSRPPAQRPPPAPPAPPAPTPPPAPPPSAPPPEPEPDPPIRLLGEPVTRDGSP